MNNHRHSAIVLRAAPKGKTLPYVATLLSLIIADILSMPSYGLPIKLSPRSKKIPRGIVAHIAALMYMYARFAYISGDGARCFLN